MSSRPSTATEDDPVSPVDLETLLDLGFGEPNPEKQAAALEEWRARLRERVA